MRVLGCLKPRCAMKVKGPLVRARGGNWRPTGRSVAPLTDRSLAKDSSKSISVGTRKMVNYA